jgi:hypothetical protein
MQLKTIALVLLVLNLALADAKCSGLIEMRLEDLVSESDIVVVGTPEGLEFSVHEGGKEFAVQKFSVTRTLKGEVLKKIVVYVDLGVPELSLGSVCCRGGKKFLLFLKRAESGRYLSTNRKWAVLALD